MIRVAGLAWVIGLGAAAHAQQSGEQTSQSFGLDARLRYEFYDPAGFGAGPQDDDGYVLWRAMPRATVRLDPDVRIHVQGIAANIRGREGGSRANDRNELDLSQAYLEWRPDAERETFLRVGRQEIALGSGRLLAANDGANVRRQFDGVLASHDLGDWSLIGVASALVRVRPGVLDDRSSTARAMGGFGLVRRSLDGDIDAIYGIYARRPDAVFGAPSARQERYTLGGRIVRRWQGNDVEIEAIAQTGEAGAADVEAWALAGDVGRTFETGGAASVRASVKFSAASGDRDRTDFKLQAFDPLFSNPVYAGSVPLIAPTNVIAINPAISLTLRRGMGIAADAAFLWRTSDSGDIYAFSGQPIAAGPSAAASKDVGVLMSVNLFAAIAEGVIASATLSRFEAGDYFAGRTGDTNAMFLNLTLAK